MGNKDHIIPVKQDLIAPIYSLGPDFYDEVESAPFHRGLLRFRNQAAAASIELNHLSEADWKKYFCDFEPLPGNIKKPLALRYHGHQFQSYNPELGDGRGFLFAQIQSGSKLFDLGTKGSGQTPYSRKGDGRLTLKGAFREILATEMLESLGVNTSKTLSVFETGEELIRYDEPSPTRAGVLVRLNHSHIRYGTFQRLAHLSQTENLRKLLQYCIRHFYPHLQNHTEDEQAFLFLQAVSQAAAKTLAGWMIGGFVHGVLNTDNMNITGESFDYGPYRFIGKYDPAFTAAYFDHSGLYSYGRQPTAVLWNLYQLGGALKVAFPHLPTEEVLAPFGDLFNVEIQETLKLRLNLQNPLQDTEKAEDLDQNLVLRFFQFLDESKGLFEQSLFDFNSGISTERLARSPQSEIYSGETFKALQDCLEKFEVKSSEKQQAEYFKRDRPCSLLIDELEAIWLPIAEKDNWSLFEEKLQSIRSFRGLFK